MNGEQLTQSHWSWLNWLDLYVRFFGLWMVQILYWHNAFEWCTNKHNNNKNWWRKKTLTKFNELASINVYTLLPVISMDKQLLLMLKNTYAYIIYTNIHKHSYLITAKRHCSPFPIRLAWRFVSFWISFSRKFDQ